MKLLTQAYAAGIILTILKTVWMVIEAKLLYAQVNTASVFQVNGFVMTLSLSLNGVTVATLALQVLFGLVILVGLYKKNITYVMIVLGPIGVCYVLEGLVFIGGLVYLATQFQGSTMHYNVGVLMAYTANLLVTPVFLWIIRRYYLNARDNSEDQGIYGQKENNVNNQYPKFKILI